MAGCKCLAKVGKLLAEKNTGIVATMAFMPGSESKALVWTYRLSAERGKPKAANVIASFCPFCGRKYKINKASPGAPGVR